MQPISNISLRALEGQISNLQQLTNELTRAVSQVKKAHIYNEDASTNIEAAADLLAEIDPVVKQVYDHFSQWQNSQESRKGLLLGRKIVAIRVACIRASITIKHLKSIEDSSHVDVRQTQNDMEEMLLAVVDSGKTIKDRVEILQERFEKVLGDAEDSPRNIGIDFLEYFNVAIVKLSGERSNINAFPQLEVMHTTICQKIEQISKRSLSLHFGANKGPVVPKDLQSNDAAVTELLERASACKEKLSFWSSCSLWRRIVCCVKRWRSPCETLGGSMENGVAAQIGGVAKKLDRKLTKLLAGKITPEKVERIGKKLKLYAACYYKLNTSLQEQRVRINALDIDRSWLMLDRYRKHLNYELVEVGYRIEQLIKLSGGSNP